MPVFTIDVVLVTAIPAVNPVDSNGELENVLEEELGSHPTPARKTWKNLRSHKRKRVFQRWVANKAQLRRQALSPTQAVVQVPAETAVEDPAETLAQIIVESAAEALIEAVTQIVNEDPALIAVKSAEDALVEALTQKAYKDLAKTAISFLLRPPSKVQLDNGMGGYEKQVPLDCQRRTVPDVAPWMNGA